VAAGPSSPSPPPRTGTSFDWATYLSLPWSAWA